MLQHTTISTQLQITFGTLFYCLVTIYSCVLKHLLQRVSHGCLAQGIIIDSTRYEAFILLYYKRSPNACV